MPAASACVPGWVVQFTSFELPRNKTSKMPISVAWRCDEARVRIRIESVHPRAAEVAMHCP